MTCEFCAEDVADGATKCPHCGERLIGRGEMLASEDAAAEPDLAFAAKLSEWPEDSLVRAIRDHHADYAPGQRRALIDELKRRRVYVPEPRVVKRSLLDQVATALALVLAGLVAAGVLRRLFP